ncbi:MAG TPA: hypothetical protein VGN83_28990 [Falsiroseomonas sp.]|jgi:hypothetical protein|nr:hypothetical protein [Falsiroseomonas sp.]
MTENELLAQAAGLGAPWRGREAEIAQAIATARRMAGGFRHPADERAEPMPAFAVPSPGGARA